MGFFMKRGASIKFINKNKVAIGNFLHTKEFELKDRFFIDLITLRSCEEIMDSLGMRFFADFWKEENCDEWYVTIWCHQKDRGKLSELESYFWKEKREAYFSIKIWEENV